MDTLLSEIREGIDYLNLQGKQVNKIKMNSKIFENMSKLNGVKVSNNEAALFGIIIEADENIEKYAFILEKAEKIGVSEVENINQIIK